MGIRFSRIEGSEWWTANRICDSAFAKSKARNLRLGNLRLRGVDAGVTREKCRCRDGGHGDSAVRAERIVMGQEHADTSAYQSARQPEDGEAAVR